MHRDHVARGGVEHVVAILARGECRVARIAHGQLAIDPAFHPLCGDGVDLAGGGTIAESIEHMAGGIAWGKWGLRGRREHSGEQQAEGGEMSVSGHGLETLGRAGG